MGRTHGETRQDYAARRAFEGEKMRDRAADAYAVRQLNLAPNDQYLNRRQFERFRRYYTEAYMNPAISGHADPVEVEMACPCAARTYPHYHSTEDKERARRAFAFHLKQGREGQA